MQSRFPQRVALERLALDVVNQAFDGTPPLVGLSSKTVDLWLRSLGPHVPAKYKARVAAVLSNVAEAARSEADVSDEIFVDIDEVEAAAAVERLRAALKIDL